MNPTMNPIHAKKKETLGEINFGAQPVGAASAVQPDKQKHRTTIHDLASESRDESTVHQISFDKTHTTRMVAIDQTTKGSFNRQGDALVQLQNPNVSQIA